MYLSQILAGIGLKLKAVSDSPDLEAEVLLARSLGQTRSHILAHPEYELGADETRRLARLSGRRLSGEPLAYVLGYQEFFGLDFRVNHNVLVPRPETELLVEEILRLPANPRRAYLDLGTGSGCVIISLAKNIKSAARFLGLDLSSPALSIARRNAKDMGVSDKIIFEKSDLLSAIIKSKKILDGADELAIAANLPYVPSAYLDHLDQPDTIPLKFEPRMALDGGPDGLDIYRRLAGQLAVSKTLLPDLKIKLYAEIQPGQADGMRQIFGSATEIIKDYCGKDRLAVAGYDR